ncbi:unnamed protein product [Ostreobium quekettii]|uniref:RNA helicase n=1 Tax=Ostreobium quekettii TaxID=121088 RepID=A0A8S1J224_9CHLO|nr:unnamed protein product [Ostreobium quekettii]|eukprot:evm.model.scf_3086.2 EVM.evm.TU.scf_3086.2   scf_3086:8492-13157(-)
MNGANAAEQPGGGGTLASLSATVAALAERVSDVQVEGEAEGKPDEPDPSLKSTGLKESDKDVETNVVGETMYSSASTFEELGLTKELLEGLYSEMKFQRPSKVQATTLPMILTPPYRDLIAQAHNGSGKTTCFVLSMLTRVDPVLHEPQALCVCPTRELVAQNQAVLLKMGKYTQLESLSTSTTEELPTSQKIKAQIIFGTHGRLKFWISRRMLGLGKMKVVVLDEADNMLEGQGFADDSFRMIREIRSQSPNIQLLMFSATYNDVVRKFACRITKEANEVFLPKEELSLEVIKQYRVNVPQKEDKVWVLLQQILPNCEKLGQTIIFVRTREMARVLHGMLTKDGFKCTAISGEMPFDKRDQVVNEFRSGVTTILISTDVLSRGFNVDEVTLVVNYDIPTDRNREPAYETYLHRIGRSGRFGRKGVAFNLCVSNWNDGDILDRISEYFQRQIPEVQYDDEEVFLKILKDAGLTEG